MTSLLIVRAKKSISKPNIQPNVMGTRKGGAIVKRRPPPLENSPKKGLNKMYKKL